MGRHARNGKGVETVYISGSGLVRFTGKGCTAMADSDPFSKTARIIVSVDAREPKVVLEDIGPYTRVVVNGRRFN